MKNILLTYCLLCCSFLAYSQSKDTFQVYFPLNDPNISKQASAMMDQLVFNDKLVHGQKLIVLGYADYLGDNAHNDPLSAARAKNVKAYLVSSGLDGGDIKLCMGKGKINRAPVNGKEGYETDRKVQIIIDRQRAVDLQTANAPGSKKSIASVSASSLKVNATYPLDILFENSSSIILTKSNPQLKLLYDFMVKYSTVRIQIEGHICCLDPKEVHADGVDSKFGGPLSWNRAKAIYDFLVAHNISKSRLSYIGLGNTLPLVYPEVTDEDKEKNRRVEIRILGK